MKNRIVGYIIIGITLVIGLIIFSFNRALSKIVSTACSHGESCPMWGTLGLQTNISLSLMIFIGLIGLYLVFFGKEEVLISEAKKSESKKINKEKYAEVLKDLDEEEKNVFEKLLEAEGTIFQSDLVEKTNLNKVKVTRILDKLEGKALIERKRRGMTNVVILKH
ncbi:MAG: MarR family transcriptional regulator [Candidatus Woesearchaeota archaeon]